MNETIVLFITAKIFPQEKFEVTCGSGFIRILWYLVTTCYHLWHCWLHIVSILTCSTIFQQRFLRLRQCFPTEGLLTTRGLRRTFWSLKRFQKGTLHMSFAVVAVETCSCEEEKVCKLRKRKKQFLQINFQKISKNSSK